jgi:hypothetical protein
MLQFRHPVSGENLKIVADVPSLPEWTYFVTGLIDS